MEGRRRTHLAPVFEATPILFICAVAFGWVRMRQLGISGWTPSIVVMSLPLSATLLFMFVGMLVPALTAPGRLQFPLNFTLPAVFAALTVTSVSLWTTTGSATFAVPPLLRHAFLWTEPVSLIGVFAAQAITMTLVTKLQTRPR